MKKLKRNHQSDIWAIFQNFSNYPELTWTTAEQIPAIKAEAKIISTLNANRVNAQDIDRGIDINISVFRRPCLSIKLEQRPPKSAPRRDRLAIHEPC